MTNTVSTPSWFTFPKSVKPSNFDCPSRLQNPINLDIDKYVTSRILFCKCLPHLLSYSIIYLSFSSVISLSYFTHESFSLYAPQRSLLMATPLTFCICHQMFLTSLTPKHMYSYISETNLESSTKIIVSTGYNLLLPDWWNHWDFDDLVVWLGWRDEENKQNSKNGHLEHRECGGIFLSVWLLGKCGARIVIVRNGP